MISVAIVADLLEEGWPSMDLVAEMLVAHAADASTVSATLLRPAFAPMVPALLRRADRPVPITERIARRFWSYPRWLRAQPPADLYHIVDHSYAHLAGVLPAGRVVVSCHDVDAFRTLLGPGERESSLPRVFARRVLAGLQRAAAVACGSEHTRSELVRHGLVRSDRACLVPHGVHPACTPAPDATADAAAAALTGPCGGAELLHVGSTIPRKRIDVLLDVLAAVARDRPAARLWRVGGEFTPAQLARARALGVADRITVLPFVSRPVLAALYRRAALVLLPSAREGFGLPVVEAMACGTPVVCTDLPVLREVAGEAAEYCGLGDVPAWAGAVVRLLDERDRDDEGWSRRRSAGLARAARFSWAAHASALRDIYRRAAAAGRMTA
jgi:glycosyltransferase involved in cell wall biosynthesis